MSAKSPGRPTAATAVSLAAAAAIAALAGCSGGEEPASDPGVESRTPAGEDVEGGDGRMRRTRLADSELGELRPEEITFTLPWTRDRIDRDASDDDAPVSLRSLAYSRVGDNVDRMTLLFDTAGGFPDYTVDSSVEPLPRCDGGEPVEVEGEGLLRIRLRGTGADEDAAGAPLERPDLDNVLAVHRSCVTEDSVEWIVDVERATFYRVVHAVDPSRLVVDVLQRLEEAPAREGAR